MRWVPAGLIFLLTGLAVAGGYLRAYELSPMTRCNYVLAEQALAATDVVLIGPSRVRRGLDPDYIEALLVEAGMEVTVDRLSLNNSGFPQIYPLLNRYLENRGPPKIAYLQLAYNQVPEKQATVNLPLNPLRNLAFAQFSELAEIQSETLLNDTGTILPRQLHALWQNLPAAWLTQVEISIFSGLRYIPKRLLGQMPECTGDFLRANGSKQSAFGLDVKAGETIAFVPPDPTKLMLWRARVAEFLPLAPSAKWRQGETAQLRKLIDMLQAAGTEVVLLIMPAFEQRTISPKSIDEINQVFPSIGIHFPMSAYEGDLARKISKSFVDSRHANKFGAVYLSRALAADLQQRLITQ
jgi:hypothetical protein